MDIRNVRPRAADESGRTGLARRRMLLAAPFALSPAAAGVASACAPSGTPAPSAGKAPVEIKLSSWNYRTDLVRKNLDIFEEQNPDIKVLGPEYVVWDKAATIQFRRPGRDTLYAAFHLTDDVVAAIHRALAERGKAEWRFTTELVDASGQIHASCEKVVSIHHRAAPRSPVERLVVR